MILELQLISSANHYLTLSSLYSAVFSAATIKSALPIIDVFKCLTQAKGRSTKATFYVL